MSKIKQTSKTQYVYEGRIYDSLNILKEAEITRINSIIVEYLKFKYKEYIHKGTSYNYYYHSYGFVERDFYLEFIRDNPNKIQEKLFNIKDETERLNNALREFEWGNKNA